MGQEIGNVGLLNLTKATEKSISGINKIENVGMILYTKDNKHLISRLNIRNIGQSVEVPEEYSVINGKLTINKGFFR
ncbi:MAG: hypothetical protein LRY73_11190 [Bacillus sp. (in: Bacteria)]|nr:hypothetical protein [Bacillus sp. (in: firmicutes)]